MLLSPHLKTSDNSLPRGCDKALRFLLQAHEFAVDLSLDPWDFAIEIAHLRQVGVSHSEVRWLLCKEFIEHRNECSLDANQERQFRHANKLMLSDRSCFVLTTFGLTVARRQHSPTQSVTPYVDTMDRPRYLADLKELWMGGKMVKQFKVPARNQELILSVFQEEGWPTRVDDPLPPQKDLEPKRRLHDAIHCLNRNQKPWLIRFKGDGSGKGIRWDPV